MGKFIGPILYKAAEGLFGEGVFYGLLVFCGIVFAVVILVAICSNTSEDSDGNNSISNESVEYGNSKSSTSCSGPIIFLLMVVFLPMIVLLLYGIFS